MSDDFVVLAYLPAVPLIVVTIPLCLHLALFIRHKIGSGFAHITNLGWFIIIIVVMWGGILYCTIEIADIVTRHLLHDPMSFEFLGLMIFNTSMVAWVCRKVAHYCGRCVFIHGKHGSIRYYSMRRFWPQKAERNIDDVGPLFWNGECVDMWGLEMLRRRMDTGRTEYGLMGSQLARHGRISGDISARSIDRMVTRINDYLADREWDEATASDAALASPSEPIRDTDYRVTVIDPLGIKKQYEFDGADAVIGDSRLADIVISGADISRKHAQITCAESLDGLAELGVRKPVRDRMVLRESLDPGEQGLPALVVTDLDSSTGTKVNGLAVDAHVLSEDDDIAIADFTLRVRFES